MVSFNFTDSGPNYYGYDAGVNADNLTKKDINKANARIDPFRQQRIVDGLLKATRDDASYVSPKAATAATAHLINYAKWTKKELVKAIVERKVKSAKKAKNLYVCLPRTNFKTQATDNIHRTKFDMVAALEKADKNPQFHRFLDLSAELRNAVYKFAIADADPKNKPRVRPETPAISRVNHQLRDETLPLFFRHTCMTIVVSAGPSKARPLPQRRTSRTHSAELSKEYLNYLIHADRAGWLQHMRHFQWRVMGLTVNRNGGIVGRWDERYFVKFANSMLTVETSTGEEDKDGRLEAVQAKMAETTDDLSTRMTPVNFYTMMAFFMGRVVRRTPK